MTHLYRHRSMKWMAFITLLIGLQGFTHAESVEKKTTLTSKVMLETNMGNIVIQLDHKKAPISSSNFLTYVDEGFYKDTVFHRVIPGFMIQGGGFDQQFKRKTTHMPIKNEAMNQLDNKRGTIAMARTSLVDSATSQFFINLVNNRDLNHSPMNYGYAVFGQVIKGMDVVDRIGGVPTKQQSMHQNAPVKPIIIKKAVRMN